MTFAENSNEPLELVDGLCGRAVPGHRQRVLWIHGYTVDSSVWEEVWQELPGWHHYGLDLPGHGTSRDLKPNERLSDLARTVGDWAIENEIDHLVGLSFGTILTLQIGIEYPDKFSSMTLAAPALAGGPQDTTVEQIYEKLLASHTRASPEELLELWVAPESPLFLQAREKTGLWQSLLQTMSRHRWSELANGGLYSLLEDRQREYDLRKIQIPTLLLVGEHELPAFRRCAELLRRSIPHANREYIPGLGHLCLIEDARLVRERMIQQFEAGLDSRNRTKRLSS